MAKNESCTVNTKRSDIRQTQEERRAQTRIALLQSTIDQIASCGLADAKLANIAAGANVTTGAVQHLFGNRDGLILAAIDEMIMRTSDGDGVLERQGSLVDRMTALGNYRLELAGRTSYRALVDIFVNARYETGFADQIRQHLLKKSTSFEAWYIWYMSGLGIPKTRLRTVERLLVSAFYGLEMMSMTRWNEEEYEEILMLTIDGCIRLLQDSVE